MILSVLIIRLGLSWFGSVHWEDNSTNRHASSRSRSWISVCPNGRVIVVDRIHNVWNTR